MREPRRRDSADPRGRDSADPHSRDGADPLGRDSADPLGRDSADPRRRDGADPLGRDSADPLGRDSADPHSRDGADPRGRDGADPHGRDSADPHGRDGADPRRRDGAGPLGTDLRAADLHATFLRDGWLVAAPFLTPAEIDALRAGFEDIVDDAVRAARYPSRDVCLRLIQLWHDPWRVSPAYADLLARPELLALARACLGCEDVRFLSQRLIVKPPDGRTPLPWHQDFAHGPLSEPRGALLWIALDDVDGTTGGLRYLTGSHLSEEPPMGTDAVGARVPAGHVLVHHPQVWHAASSNRSASWRRACLVTVADARTPRRTGAWDPARFPLLPWRPGAA